jgi:hypothetical protein
VQQQHHSARTNLTCAERLTRSVPTYRLIRIATDRIACRAAQRSAAGSLRCGMQRTLYVHNAYLSLITSGSADSAVYFNSFAATACASSGVLNSTKTEPCSAAQWITV